MRSNSNKEHTQDGSPKFKAKIDQNRSPNKTPFSLYEKQLKNDARNMPVEWEDFPVAKSTLDLR